MILLVVAAFVLLADQLTKIWIRGALSLGDSIPVIKDVFHLTYVKNPGAIFGLFPDRQLLFLITALVTIVFIIFYYSRIEDSQRLVKIALGLELGGALGNLIDRVIYGRVTDFLDFHIWPVFNIADSAIIIGLGLLIGSILFSFKKGQTVSGR